MKVLNQLSSGWRRTFPTILQSESSECGLACLAMVASFYGHSVDLRTLRRRFPISLKGLNFSQLMHLATRLKMVSRPLKLDMDGVEHLTLPCVLHWNFQHFVVLVEYRGDSAVICDPAVGQRQISIAELSRCFTGAALELYPDTGFVKKAPAPRVRIRDLMGRTIGLRRSLGQIAFLALAAEMLSLLMPFYVQWIVDRGIPADDKSLIGMLALCFVGMCLLQNGITAARGWMMIHLNTSLGFQWKNGVFAHLLNLPLDFFQKRHLGDVVSRTSAVDSIQKTLTTSFLDAILDGFMAIATGIAMLLYGGTLFIPVALSVSLYVLVRSIVYSYSWAANTEAIVHAAKQNSFFLETIRGIQAISLFGKREERRATWLGMLVNQLNAGLRTERATLIVKNMAPCIFGVERIVTVWWAATLSLEGSITIGVLMGFLAYREQFSGRVQALIDNYFEVRMLRLQGERLADIVYTEQEESDDAADFDLGELHHFNLEVHDVSFRYSRFDRLILEKVSLQVEEGESLAIVGPSGSGKSSLLNLLIGALPPTSGKIMVGGVDIVNIGKKKYRDLVGVVMQDDSLFSGSIADNISFFTESASREDIEQCAKLAAIHTDIMMFPMGYETLVGDMGSTLSGGQKQRILLARSIFKKPKILILDEATSHLDVELEKQVNAAIRSLHITRIIVAHRPETIASADRVVHFVNGRLVESEAVEAPST